MKKTPSFAAGNSMASGKDPSAAPAAAAEPARTGSTPEPDSTGDPPLWPDPLAQLGRVPIAETDNLNETVLGAAAIIDPDTNPPEVVRGTEALTQWDEPADAAGTWTPREGLDDGMLDAARLYEAGIEEADRERRMAAHQPDES